MNTKIFDNQIKNEVNFDYALRGSERLETNIRTVLNELLIGTFNQILDVEQNEIKKGPLNNLSISELHAIEAIGMYQERTMSQVAADLGITVGALTSFINNLVKKEYVSRQRDEADRRIVRISLTRRGKLAYRIHEKFHLDMVKHMLLGLGEQENILIGSLQKLTEFFDSKYSFNP
ncbi:MarR family transcriptional regulator [Dehalobacter sp. MCB1]|nr:MarR family transcriptional regulator [Dehalobacter sp. MCB1]TCX49081.1 MarR family transcriptional regulator [Dehalobacter sp. 14DCB1]TCX56414.1 MarR family transcriptional regulator [Dehalobacter sp. 12DCB1]